MHSDYRHCRHDDIVTGISQGKTDTAIAAHLKVDRRAVARVRSLLGLTPMTNATTVGHKISRFVADLPGGHTGWTGRRGPSGNPLIRQRGRELSATAVIFELHHGRAPVGISKADCGTAHCLTPEHILDDLGRRTVRLQLRAVHGMPAHWTTCPSGHEWPEHGRVEPDLTLYCKACTAARAQRQRDAEKEEATA